LPEPIRMENHVPGRVAKSRIATLVLACAIVEFIALSSSGDRSFRSPQRINVFCACVEYAISLTVCLPRLRVEEWLEPLGVLFDLGETLVV
jgi:hypothetical protein